jgi:hypothetical protein
MANEIPQPQYTASLPSSRLPDGFGNEHLDKLAKEIFKNIEANEVRLSFPYLASDHWDYLSIFATNKSNVFVD